MKKIMIIIAALIAVGAVTFGAHAQGSSWTQAPAHAVDSVKALVVGETAEATLSSCQAWLLTPTYAGGYAYCSFGFGGSVRVKIWCSNGVQYFGPKVYFAGVTSTKLCPSGSYATGATHILGT